MLLQRRVETTASNKEEAGKSRQTITLFEASALKDGKAGVLWKFRILIRAQAVVKFRLVFADDQSVMAALQAQSDAVRAIIGAHHEDPGYSADDAAGGLCRSSHEQEWECPCLFPVGRQFR